MRAPSCLRARAAVLVLLALAPLACSRTAPGHPLDRAPLELAEPCVVPLEPGVRPVVRVAIDGGEPLRFLVDSGASISLIDARVAEERGLESRPYAAAFETTGSSGRKARLERYVTFERFETGALVLRDGRLTVLADPVLRQAEVAGILGQDVLARLVLVVDMRRRALHLLPEGGVESVKRYLTESDAFDGAWVTAPLELRPCPYLELDVAGLERPVEIELDTGAVGTSLPRVAIDALGLEPAGTRTLGAIGGDHEAAAYRIEDLDLFGLKIDLEVTESALERGLLGMDVLGALVLVLDAPAGMLWLHHRDG